MEIIPKGRHFRLVKENELPEILKYLERYLPESTKFHQTIKTYLNDRVWDFKFYVSKDWPEKPIILHFPGCTLTPNNNIYQSFGIFCPANKIEYVDLMRTEDILINWKLPLYLNFTHKDIMNRLDDFYSTIGIMTRLEGDIYVCKKLNTNLNLDDLPEEEAEMRTLTVEDVKGIHDLYPASEIESVEVFEILVRVLPGLGIFRKDTNELAAWMVHSYYGAMFSMQTRPEYRRKGYGIRLAMTLAKLVIKRGYSPFVVIRPQNEASRNLYTKLGFEKVFETCRVKMIPGFKTNGYEITLADKKEELLISPTKVEKEVEGKTNENTITHDGLLLEDLLVAKCDISNLGGINVELRDGGIEDGI